MSIFSSRSFQIENGVLVKFKGNAAQVAIPSGVKTVGREAFRENKAIPLRVKIVSITLVWGTLLYCTLCIAEQTWLKIAFILLATAISAHILHYKTLK